MPDILSYHVLNGISDKWLDADEKSWTETFIDSAAFTSPQIAHDIGAREAGPTGIIYVMACLGTL